MPALILLGVPEEILAAVMAVLLLVGALLIARLVANLLPDIKIPLVGSLRGLVNSAMNGVIGGAKAGWEVTADGAYWLIVAPVVFTYHLVSGAINLAENIGWKLANILRVTIPQTLAVAMKFAQSVEDTVKSLIDASVALAASAVATLRASLTALINEIHAGLSADIVALQNYATSAIGALTASTTSAIQTALSLAYTFTSKVEAAIENDIAALASKVAGDIVNAEHLATAAVGQALSAAEAYALTQALKAATAAVTELDHLTQTTVAAIWQGIITDVDNVVAVAEQDFADVVTDLRSVARAVPTDIAGAIAATMAISIPLLKLAKDCTMPNCRNLSGLGRFLEDLFTDATDAALVAMLIELVHDPKSGAHEVMSSLGGLANDTVGLAKELVGV